ncbi:MAG: ribonuclease P protein component, partial [Candidatus Chromulinivorax sp.]
ELVILTAPCSLLTEQLLHHKEHDFNENFGRILLITSSKVGNAPERNLLRRRSKAIFYQEKMFTQGLHYVAIFKKPATKLSYEQLKTIFMQTITQKN